MIMVGLSFSGIKIILMSKSTVLPILFRHILGQGQGAISTAEKWISNRVDLAGAKLF